MSSLNHVLVNRQNTMGIRYDLEPFKQACKRLNNPQKQLGKIIHIAGTNGKGSTATYIKALLQSVGLKVGMFSSPHYVSYSERISIDGQPISEKEFEDRLDKLMQTDACKNLTEFELITCLAFCYFKDHSLDVCILETGLGGRLDATNVVQSDLTIITPIGLDHQAILGESIEEIASEKSGIIKEKTPVISAKQDASAAKVIASFATVRNSPLHTVLMTESWRLATHQLPIYLQENSYLAYDALRTVGWMSYSIAEAAAVINQTDCLGRFSERKWKKATFLLDSAHNTMGIQTLVNAVKERYGEGPFTWWVGIQASKPRDEMIAVIQSTGSEVYYCEFESEGKAAVAPNNETCKPLKWPPILPEEGVTIITGSIYFLGALYDKYPHLMRNDDA